MRIQSNGGCGMEVSAEEVIAQAALNLEEQDHARRLARRTAQAAERHAQEARIESMRDAADDRFTAAMIEGVSSLASTGIEMADTVRSAQDVEVQMEADALEADAARMRIDAQTASGVERRGMERSAVELDEGAARLASDLGESRLASRWAQSARDAVATSGKLFGAAYERSAAEADVRAEQFGQQASAHRLEADELGEDADRAHALQQKALSHLEQVSEARMQAHMAATRG